MDYGFQQLCSNICEKLPTIFDQEGIEYTISSNRISFTCFVHGSDKKDSACVFTQESQRGLIGNWKCFTNGCQETHGKSVINLVQDLYSKKGWSKGKTYNYLKDVTNYKEIPLTDKIKFINQVNLIKKQELSPPKDNIPISVLDNLQIPSHYYQNRNFSKEILYKHSIGECLKPTKFRNRVVIPIFSEDKTHVINFLGRSIHEECPVCNRYHKAGTFCPTTQLEIFNSAKWINHTPLNHTLYNLWHSLPFIERTGTCILVEGSSDCWKLEEAGILNSLGLLTNNLSYLQQIKLEMLPCTHVILCLDNDEKGHQGKDLIRKKLDRYFTISEIITKDNDVSDMKIEQIRELFKVNT